MISEFKKFIMRGNVLDMAVGIIIGAAFGAIISSLVSDILMPPLGIALGGVDFSNMYVLIKEGSTVGPYATLAAAKEAGAVVISYGAFINTIISFLIVAFSIFLLLRGVNKLLPPPPAAPAATKDCPRCLMAVPIKATKCGHCCSDIPA